MLARLLQLMGKGGTRTLPELARTLGVSEALVRQMLDDLTRRGYLRPVTGCACDGCGIKGDCVTGTPTQVWALRPARGLSDSAP